MNAPGEAGGSIVTFYSWKGGVGRTVALANTAVQLARRGRRVLLVDWDLEAPGLDRYFTHGEAADRIEVAPADNATGMMGLLREAFVERSETPTPSAWRSRIRTVLVPPAEPVASTAPLTELHLLPSGLGSSGYADHVAEFSWPSFFADANGGAWLEALRAQWRTEYEFVLVDSRTGLTDSGGVCTVQMPDTLVFVFTSNEQSLEDGLRLLQSLQESRRRFAYARGPLTILPLLSRWNGDDEVDLGSHWLDQMDDALLPVTASWLPRQFTRRQFLEKVRVPHVARFSFGEPLPVITHSVTDPSLPGFAYETVARLLDSHMLAAGTVIDPSYQPRGDVAMHETGRGAAEVGAPRPAKVARRRVLPARRTHAQRHIRRLSISPNGIATLTVQLLGLSQEGPLQLAALPPGFTNCRSVSLEVSSKGRRLRDDAPGVLGDGGVFWLRAPMATYDELTWTCHFSNGVALDAIDIGYGLPRPPLPLRPDEDAMLHSVQFDCGSLRLELALPGSALDGDVSPISQRPDHVTWCNAEDDGELAAGLARRGAEIALEIAWPCVGYRYGFSYRLPRRLEPLDKLSLHSLDRVLEECRARTVQPGGLFLELTAAISATCKKVLRTAENEPVFFVGRLWSQRLRRLMPAFGHFAPKTWGASFKYGAGIAGHAFRFRQVSFWHQAVALDGADDSTRDAVLLYDANGSGEVAHRDWILEVPLLLDGTGVPIGTIGFAGATHGEPSSRALESIAIRLASDTVDDEEVKATVSRFSALASGVFWQVVARFDPYASSVYERYWAARGANDAVA